MSKFPHLDTTSDFPYLDNVEVYQYDNHFDYSRFDFEQMEIIICSVPWDMGEAHIGNRTISGIGNVVDFGGKDKRDQWFANLPADECFRFSTKYRQLHRENKIGVPIPFDVASNYNYVAVEYKQMANENSPVEYESADARRNWFWFIREVEFIGPNSTVLHLMIDAWQTFIYDLDITSMILERGHAPMDAIRTSKFLENPIENNQYLLTEDVNFGDETVIRDCEYLPIGNGRKFCLFALPMMQSNIVNAGSASNTNTSLASFSDENTRWGNQLIVNGYEWGYVDDYSTVNPFIQSLMHKSDFVFNGNGVFAVASENASSFFNALAEDYMHIVNAIQAVFIVDEAHLRIDSSFTLAGFTVYNVTSKNSVHDIELTSDMFDYPDEYKDIAKLYTFPYAVLEYTDDDGLKVDLHIENTGHLSIVHELAIVFPYIQQRVFLRGANGDKSETYIWRNINNNSDTTMTLPVDDFSEYMSKWDIPTFALYVRRDRADAPGNYASMQARRAAAITDYQNTARIANTVYENSYDTQSTNVANTRDRQNVYVANVDDSMSTMVANVNRDMTALTTNNERACTTAESNKDEHNYALSDINDRNNQKIATDASISNGLAIATTAQNDGLAAITYGNSYGAMVQSTAIGAAGNLASGVVTGGLHGALTSGIQGVTQMAQTLPAVQSAGANLLASISNDQAVVNLTTLATAAYAQEAQYCNNVVTTRVESENNTITLANTALARAQMTTTASTNRADANASAAMENGNASRTQTMENGNASRTQATEVNNNDWSRDATIANAQTTLRLRQLEEQARWRDRAKSQPVVMTQFSGDAYQDVFKRRGVRLNVRTQSKSAIKSVGDEFLRYGYMLDQQWDFDGNWNILPYFTYWKLRDFWIKSLNVPDMYVDRIRFFLFGGVTVWRDPSYIGQKTIYENFND